jgi:hypothetical protein
MTVDDQALVRAAVTQLITQEPELTVAGMPHYALAMR